LKSLHEQVQRGEADPDLPLNPEEYARKRRSYRETGRRESDETDQEER
jgi:hypothetical protein